MAKFNWERANKVARDARRPPNYKPDNQVNSLSKKNNSNKGGRYVYNKRLVINIPCNIQEKINKINDVFSSECNEEEVLSTVTSVVEGLRREWKRNKNIFNKEDVERLKVITSKLEAVRRLVFFICHPEHIHENYYPLRPINELRKLEDKIRGMAIESKLKSQIQNIIENKNKVASNVKMNRQATRQDIIFKVKIEAPQCPKCNIKMILKEGRNAFFYGCDNYPGCRQIKWINRQVNESINRLDPRNQY